jgi:hypothetical protein
MNLLCVFKGRQYLWCSHAEQYRLAFDVQMTDFIYWSMDHRGEASGYLVD